PPSASLAEVSTPGRARPAALLSALKPRGNPLASGRPGRPGRDAGVTIRLRDADGLPAQPPPAHLSPLPGLPGAPVTHPPRLPPTSAWWVASRAPRWPT